MNLILIGSFSALYLAIHLLNSLLFQSIEITSHVSMVYLPAFLRLFNVLVPPAKPQSSSRFPNKLKDSARVPYLDANMPAA